MKQIFISFLALIVLGTTVDTPLVAKTYQSKSKSRISNTKVWKVKKKKIQDNHTKYTYKKNKTMETEQIVKTEKPKNELNYIKNINKKKQERQAQFSYTQFKDKKKPVVKLDSNTNKILNKTSKKDLLDYRNQKKDYYTKIKYIPTTVVYESRPSFGIYDSLFLWAMLDNINDSRYRDMYYHHQNDEAFREWRREADRLASSNDDLQRQLYQLDAQMNKMKGTPIQDDYVSDIPPAVMYNENVISNSIKEKSMLRLGTASRLGNYYKIGTILKHNLSNVNIQIVETDGSIHNLELLLRNKLDGAFVQNDAFKWYKKSHSGSNFVVEQANLYKEYAHVLASKKSKIKRLADVNSETVIYTGVKGSGSDLTWRTLCDINPKYKKAKVVNLSPNEAILKVANNPNTLLFYVSGLNNSIIGKANAIGHKFKFVAIKDKKLVEAKDDFGDSIYNFKTINDDYNKIADGVFGTRTIVVDSTLVLTSKWFDEQGASVYEEFTTTIDRLIPKIRKVVK